MKVESASRCGKLLFIPIALYFYEFNIQRCLNAVHDGTEAIKLSLTKSFL